MATKKPAATATNPLGLEMPTMESLQKLAEQFKLPGVDVNALVEWQRKDMEALAEAQREAYEGMQAVVAKRTEILAETLSQMQAAMKDMTGADALAKSQDAAQRGVQQAMTNFQELSKLQAEAGSRAWKVVQDRMQENMGNLQKLLQPKK